MACVGQGGQGGHYGRGGSGGGVDVGGENGQGRLSGTGGPLISSGNLGGNGRFGGSYQAPTLYPGDLQGSSGEGGRTISCTKGVYWAERGVGACNDTTSHVLTADNTFRLSDGTQVTNTATSITRGFKAGYNIMQTASNRLGDGGCGGTCSTGGNGAASGGGGGGSGYQDGSVTVVDTKLGGSTGNAKVVLRVVT